MAPIAGKAPVTLSRSRAQFRPKRYVTVAGARNLPPVTRGSYVTVDGTPVVAAGTIEGSYVTLPAAA